MKENRYSTLKKEYCRQYTEGSPIILEAYALLKDNVSGSVLTQIKFSNIGTKIISCVVVSVEAFDATGEALEGVQQYQYLDVNAARGAFFGSKQAIIMPDAITRRVNIRINKVVFADDEIWQPNQYATWESIPKQETVGEHFKTPEERMQYRKNHAQGTCIFMPVKFKDLLLCNCGTISKNTETNCRKCGWSLNSLFEINDEDVGTAEEERKVELVDLFLIVAILSVASAILMLVGLFV